MSDLRVVQIAIGRVVKNASSPSSPNDNDPSSTASNRVCHICQHPLQPNDLYATLSCCYAAYHAGCLSEWILSDHGGSDPSPTGQTSLAAGCGGPPRCTGCNARFCPRGFHKAMTMMATREVGLLSAAERGDEAEETNGTEIVKRIVVCVRGDVKDELSYNAMGLERRALRGQQQHRSELFQDPVRSSGNEHGTSTDAEELDEDGDEEPDDDLGSLLPSEVLAPSIINRDVFRTMFERGRARHTPVHRQHWRYGTGRTIDDTPTETDEVNEDDNDDPLPDQMSEDSADEEEDQSESASLYSYQHGVGQRLGEEPTNIDTPINTAIMMPTIEVIPQPQLQPQPPAPPPPPTPLYSYEFGQGTRLGTSEINIQDTPYLHSAPSTSARTANNRTQGVAGWTDQLRVLGRFRHEHGLGRTLGE